LVNPEGHSPRYWRRHRGAEKPWPKLPAEILQPTRSFYEKFVGFIESAILWGGIGVLVGATASLYSLRILFVVSYVILCVATLKAAFFSGARIVVQVVANLFACSLIAAMFVILWRYTPKPAVMPSLDEQSNALFGMLAKKAPWLVSPPIPQPVVIQGHQEATMEFTRTQLDVSGGAIFMSDHPTEAVVGYKNTTSGAAHDVYAEAQLELLPRAGNVYTSKAAVKAAEAEENRRFHAFRQQWLQNSYKGEGNDEEMGKEEIMGIKTHDLKWNEVRDVAALRLKLYAFGAIKWRDDTGTYESDLCWYYDGLDGIENGVQKVIWTKCTSGHYKVRRVFDAFKD
jgi:hypothetical protein